MGEIALSAELFDISSFGCRISVDAVFSPGEEIQIALADFEPVIATAVWQKGQAVGCRFLHPISSDILRSLTLEE